MNTSEIKKDLTNDNDIKLMMLKIARNSGQLSEEVIKMCTEHIDALVKQAFNTFKFSQEQSDAINNLVLEIKKEPEWLVKVSRFADQYEEILGWNKLIHEKKVPENFITRSHRECDSAFFDELCTKYDDVRNTLSMLFFYGVNRKDKE